MLLLAGFIGAVLAAFLVLCFAVDGHRAPLLAKPFADGAEKGPNSTVLTPLTKGAAHGERLPNKDHGEFPEPDSDFLPDQEVKAAAVQQPQADEAPLIDEDAVLDGLVDANTAALIDAWAGTDLPRTRTDGFSALVSRRLNGNGLIGISTGVEGPDTFSVGYAPGGGPLVAQGVAGRSQLLDFDAAEDQLIVVYDDRVAGTPSLELRSSARAEGVMEVVVDGAVISELSGSSLPALDDIVLMGEAELQGLLRSGAA